METKTSKRATLIDTKLAEEAIQWRRDLHQIPELQFDLHKTQAYLICLLEEWSVSYDTGYGTTGIVATIDGAEPGKTIAFRCDMDALPIEDKSGKPWSSKHDGCSHACGHDGHMATMLAAIKHLSENRNFKGTVKVLFQPNEETGQGAKTMMKDGLYKDHPYTELFGFHNMPRLEDKTIQVRFGATTGAGEMFTLTIVGKSGHSSTPDKCINPISVASEIIYQWNLITSRVDPKDMAVIAVCKMNSGSSMNGIPDQATVGGTMRYFESYVADYMQAEMHRTAKDVCEKYAATYDLSFEVMCPATVNTNDATNSVLECGKELYGIDNVIDDFPPSPGGEDMQFFVTQEVKDVCLFMIGTKGENLHTSGFDFDDTSLHKSASMLISLAYNRLS